MSENLKIYDSCRSVPDAAKKTIAAGKLKGFTDINPMWRIQKLTEMFGMCGVGWYTKIERIWCEDGKDGRIALFCEISLFVKVGNEWSMPIIGVGGSMLQNQFKGSPELSDEAVKMAYTDAISVACKALGMGADVYWDKGRETKYDTTTQEEPVICPKCREKLHPVIHTKERAYTAAEYLENCGMCPKCYVRKNEEEKNAGEKK